MGSIALDVLIRDGSMHAGTTKHVLQVLGSYADPDGRGVRVSVPTLARAIGRSERTVRYAIARLAASGELCVTVRRGLGHTNEYALNRGLLAENLQRRRENLQRAARENLHPAPRPANAAGFHGENLQSAAGFAGRNLQSATPNPAQNLQSATAKPANAAPHRVRSDRVTKDDGTGKGRPAGRPGARAREAASAIASSLEARLGIARDEGLLAELLEEFPELDAPTLHGEIVAAATKRVRGKPWTLGDWRAWLLARPRRKEAANGSHANAGGALAGIGRRSDQLGC